MHHAICTIICGDGNTFPKHVYTHASKCISRFSEHQYSPPTQCYNQSSKIVCYGNEPSLAGSPLIPCSAAFIAAAAARNEAWAAAALVERSPISPWHSGSVN
jgi:hypothetical protein